MVVEYTDSDNDKWIFFSGSSDIYSQWYPSKFLDEDGITYSCAEQYMMSQKAKLFNDLATNSLIMKTTDPKRQKSLGRQVKNFDAKVWNDNCEEIVTQGNVYKFYQNKSLMKELLDTGNATLVEASPWDSTWGVGVTAEQYIILIKAEKELPGRNLLGKCIMKARKIILEDEE